MGRVRLMGRVAEGAGEGNLARALYFSLAATEALDRNGWAVKGITLDEPMAGMNPGGVVVFDRGRTPSGRPGGSWGTAEWTIENGTVSFFSGHYDLTREEAFADFAGRSERRR